MKDILKEMQPLFDEVEAMRTQRQKQIELEKWEKSQKIKERNENFRRHREWRK
ncbi:MAG TPA: hypothetical protein PLI61_13835 [bacterium]|nr:hypothetical protein [bacterium]